MAQRPIAIIGMAARFPHCGDVQAYWHALTQGRDCVSTVPGERWDARLFAGDAPGQPGRTYCDAAGMDATGDCYDASFFGIDAADLPTMDPQQGRVLELAWHACEDAGIAPDSLAGQDVGVFVGVSTRDFDRRMSGLLEHINFHTSTGASGAVIANRLSYLFGLTGPSMALDAACASSLVSVHQACQALAHDECSLALAGGVQLILSPANIIAFAQAGMLARDGRCKPFAAGADGYVCGEGAGMLLLKPLERAQRDGDRIRAVIRGSAVNHNGRSNGLSAPYRAAQQQVMRTALQRADLPAHSIGYIEAHAPGTLIGDAIEFQAIRDVYGAGRDAANACHVGSVKSNIGHLEAAAGVAALIKAALAVEHGVLPASLHSETPSTLLKLGADGLRLCAGTQPWPPGPGARRAALNAFSFSGANAHMLLEQAPTAPAPACDPAHGPWLLVASARSAAALAQLCAAYRDHLVALRADGAALEALRDFASSTLAHRAHLPLRVAITVRTWQDAIDGLAAAAAAAAPSRRLRLAILPAEAGPVALGGAWTRLAEIDGALLDSARDLPPDLRLLATLLARLGVRKVHFADAPAAPLGQFAILCRAAGLAVTEGERAPTQDCLTLVDARGATDTVDGMLWNSRADFMTQCTDLLARLYRAGFQLRWSAFAALTGYRSVPLPLYPFQRARHHVIPDRLLSAA